MDNHKLVALSTVLFVGLLALLASSSVGRVHALSVASWVPPVPVTSDPRRDRDQPLVDDEDDDDEDDDSPLSWTEEDLRVLRNFILNSLELADNSTVPKTEQSSEEMENSYQDYHRSRGETERRPKRVVEEDPLPEDIIYTYHNQGMNPPADVSPLGDNRTASWLYFSMDGLANVSSVRTSSAKVFATLQLHHNAEWTAAATEGASQSSPPTVFGVYHVSADHRLTLVDSRPSMARHGDAYLLDVTSSVRSWIRDPSLNLGLLLTCTHCDRLDRLVALRSPTITAPQLVVRTTQDSSQQQRQRTKRSPKAPSINELIDGALLGTGRGDCERRKKGKGGSKTCCRKHLNVSFAELGIVNIVHPTEFSAYYCQGKCPHKENPVSTHAVIQSLARMNKERHRKIPQPCCAPTVLKDLPVSYRKEPNRHVDGVLKNAIVWECGCS